MKHIYFSLFFIVILTSALSAQKNYDFESTATSITFQYFGSKLDGTSSAVINNPDASGINTSAKVGHFIKPSGAEVWAGGFANPAITPIDATSGGTVCLKVWMDHVGNVAVKLEAPIGGGENWITTQPYTTPNTWQELCFDLTAPSIEDSKLPATGKIFGTFVLFCDFLVAAGSTDESYYIDDVKTPTGEVTVITTTILDFEAPSTTGEFQYFGSNLDGQKTMVIDNPNASGINPSSKVTKYTKPAVAEVWAGAFSNPKPQTPVDASGTNQVCIKVHMDHIGNVALKFEGSTSAKPNWIQTVKNTKINEWEELCFDVTLPSLESPFEPASSVYETVVIFFDFGTAGTGTDVTSYFDDIVVKSGSTPVDKKVNFRVNMNSYTANFDRVYLSGTFNSWSGESNPLLDDDGDGIWEGSLSLPNGAYEYKVTLDNWAKEEKFLGTEECTKTTDIFTNRLLLVSADRNEPEFCFNSCYACGEEVKINFKLGMGTVVPNPDGVWLAGGGNFDVPGGKYKMSDENKDGIYELTVPRKKGFTSYFTFANGPCGDYSCKELLEGKPCGDPANFNDRKLEPVTGNIVYATCFGLCSTNAECISSVKDLAVDNNLFKLIGNPISNNILEMIFNEANDSDKNILISNTVGQIVRIENVDIQNAKRSLDISALQSGIYYVTVNTKSHTLTQKFVKL